MAWFIGWFQICFGSLSILFGILVDPLSLWEATASRKYNNPDANEPSDAEFTSRRALLVTSGVVLVFFGFGANHIASGNLLGLTNSRAALETVAQKLGTSVEVGIGGKIEPADMKHVSDRLNTAVTDYVRDVNTHGYPAADLSVDELHSADNIYSFHVSGRACDPLLPRRHRHGPSPVQALPRRRAGSQPLQPRRPDLVEDPRRTC